MKDTFSQTDDAAHDVMAVLCLRHPLAAAVLHALIRLANKRNAVVVSNAALARRFGYSERSLRRAIQTLVNDRWIARVQIGRTASVGAYILNRRVCWKDERSKRSFAAVEATLAIAFEEQFPEDLAQSPLRDTREIRNLMQMPMVDGADVQLGAEDLDE